MREHGVEEAKEFVSHAEIGLFSNTGLSKFEVKILTESGDKTSDRASEEKKDTSEVTVPSSRDMACGRGLSGLINSGVKTCVSDEFFVVLKTADRAYFGEEGSGTDKTYTRDGGKDLYFSGKSLKGEGLDVSVKFLEVLLEEKELAYNVLENVFLGGVWRSDGGRGEFFDFSDGEAGFSAPFVWWEEGLEGTFRGLLDGGSAGESQEERKEALWVTCGVLEDFGETVENGVLEEVFYHSDEGNDFFTVTGEATEFWTWMPEGFFEGMILGEEKKSDVMSIDGVSFGFSKGESGERSCLKWVKHESAETLRGQEPEKMVVITAGRFKTDDQTLLWVNREKGEEFVKALSLHGEGRRVKDLPLVVKDTDEEIFFGDVDTDEKGWGVKHMASSLWNFVVSGRSSHSKLHYDKGFLAQSTYDEYGRQETDSSKGSSGPGNIRLPARWVVYYKGNFM